MAEKSPIYRLNQGFQTSLDGDWDFQDPRAGGALKSLGEHL